MSPNNGMKNYNDDAGEDARDVDRPGAPKAKNGGDDAAAPVATPEDAPLPAPNSTPRDEADPDEDTYVYRDFATVPAPALGGAGGAVALHPQSLQAQKLPAKLASILSDSDLTSVIIWLPHGRSWRVLNRDLFAEHALPRYFGHKNYASFVRIVNAWGFRRISRGADRDAYYHELFLRGRPDLHQRMKRLSTCHRKTPVNKDDKCPNFYELAKTSPLPQITMKSGGQTGGGGIVPETQLVPGIGQGQMSQFSSLGPSRGLQGTNYDPLGSLGGSMANINENMLSRYLTNDVRSTSSLLPSLPGGNPQASALPRLAQLQRDNEELRRRIIMMENKNKEGQVGGQAGLNQLNQPHSSVPVRFGTLSAGLGGGRDAVQGTGGGRVDELERELARMQRDFAAQQRPHPPAPTGPASDPVNNSMNDSLLSSLGGGNGRQGDGGGAGPRSEFSFMSGFPRNEMLLRAMRLENQMGFLGTGGGGAGAGQQSSAASALELERAYHGGGSPSSAFGATPMQGGQDDRRKVLMEWMANQQPSGPSTC